MCRPRSSAASPSHSAQTHTGSSARCLCAHITGSVVLRPGSSTRTRARCFSTFHHCLCRFLDHAQQGSASSQEVAIAHEDRVYVEEPIARSAFRCFHSSHHSLSKNFSTTLNKAGFAFPCLMDWSNPMPSVHISWKHTTKLLAQLRCGQFWVYRKALNCNLVKSLLHIQRGNIDLCGISPPLCTCRQMCWCCGDLVCTPTVVVPTRADFVDSQLVQTGCIE